jgi:hypothetical protein
MSGAPARRSWRPSTPTAPTALDPAGQADLTAAVQAPPAAGSDLADWNWEVARRFIDRRAGVRLSRRTCRRRLHRLGFRSSSSGRRSGCWARPGRRAPRPGSSTKPACVPRRPSRHGALTGEPASSYSAVCLATGAVEAMGPDGNRNADTSAAILKQVRAKHAGPLIVSWDTGPAHGGEAIPDDAGPGVAPGAAAGRPPGVNADEQIRGWAREEVTANTCSGMAAKVREAVGTFVAGLTARIDAVRRRRRTALQVEAEARLARVIDRLHALTPVDPVRTLV